MEVNHALSQNFPGLIVNRGYAKQTKETKTKVDSKMKTKIAISEGFLQVHATATQYLYIFYL